MSIKSGRVWELDFIRGVAVLVMIFIHMNYTLTTFFGVNIFSGALDMESIVMAVMEYGGAVFIVISGICSCYSKNNLKRGLNLFFIAMLLTYATLIIQTYIIPGSQTLITFGILHCLSVLMIIGHFLLKIPQIKYVTNFIYLVLGAAIIIAGYILRSNDISFPVLFGYQISEIIPSADYFPLIPFLGWFIIGIFIGKTFYLKGRLLARSKRAGGFLPIRGVSFVGRHSLIFYLVHQPVIYIVCTLFAV